MDDLFADDFGYQSYANYVLNAPLILMHTKEDAYLSVQDKTCREVAKEYGWSDQAIAHYLSMVFPNIRTKNFIEIRSADSMPLNETMAYCAFLKGLFIAMKQWKNMRVWLIPLMPYMQRSHQFVKMDGKRMFMVTVVMYFANNY